MEVLDLLNKNNIEYREQGKDYIVSCLNPEHDDSNPSLRIDKITGIFGCFSCGFSGDLFKHFGEQPNYLQLRRNALRKKLIQKRAETVGLEMPQNALPYLGDHRGISPETYVKFGAFIDNDELPGRIVFPISNASDRIVCFVGRHTTGGVPKYKVYPPGAKPCIYPAKPTPIEGSALLVEGIYDVLNLHSCGLSNAVACFGTQTLTTEKLSVLKLQGIDRIDIFMDGDKAGQEAAEKIRGMCDEVGLLTRNVYMKGKDPGELNFSEVASIGKKLYDTFEASKI